jgi:ribosome-interacting GTPase 1
VSTVTKVIQYLCGRNLSIKLKKHKTKIGVLVGEELVSFIRFANDIALVASSENDLKRVLEEIAKCFHNNHIKIN